MLPEQGWPVIPTAAAVAAPPERALVLATIRQESAFEADAVSRAGARGLMQLMPATAKAVAKQLGIHGQHKDKRLTAEPAYNLRLGQTYLRGLVDDYSGSYLIALAAYNAGPGRAQSWLRENGDPRGGTVDPIDWVELIGIEETRNYVQRVMENIQVYRRVLGHADPAGALEKDFARGFR
jgi:soluble lytic murein transglycosylase